MSAMLAAIQKRKAQGQSLMGDHQDMNHKSQHAIDPETQKDMHGLVQGLSDHEKSALKQILDGDNKNEQNIPKGSPSTNERAEIAAQSQKENQQNQMEDADEKHDPSGPPSQIPEGVSDDIAKSMLDSRHIRNTAPEKPRNLGERVKQSLASKLRGKGKI